MNAPSVLEVDLAIEAASLPTAESKNALPKKKESDHILQLASLGQYRDPIVKRNFFAQYVPPIPVVEKVAKNNNPPPPERKPERVVPRVDPAKYTYVTGFTEVDGVVVAVHAPAHRGAPVIAVPIRFASPAVIARVIVVFGSGVTDAGSEEPSRRISVSIVVNGSGRASLHADDRRKALPHSLLLGHRRECQGGSRHQGNDDPVHGFLPRKC